MNYFSHQTLNAAVIDVSVGS